MEHFHIQFISCLTLTNSELDIILMLQRLSQIRDVPMADQTLIFRLHVQREVFFCYFLFSLRYLYYATFLKGQEKKMEGREEKNGKFKAPILLKYIYIYSPYLSDGFLEGFLVPWKHLLCMVSVLAVGGVCRTCQGGCCSSPLRGQCDLKYFCPVVGWLHHCP